MICSSDERVTAVRLADGWHEIMRGSFVLTNWELHRAAEGDGIAADALREGCANLEAEWREPDGKRVIRPFDEVIEVYVGDDQSSK